ncbi:MAG: HAD family hydrolase [Chloroflexota bacterium]
MPLSGILAVTLDFGNTLVPVDRSTLRSVVETTASQVCAALDLGGRSAFLAAWAEERDRQFREEVPRYREVELPQRAVRVLARLRGMTPPDPLEPWDDHAAAGRCTVDEVATVVDAYSEAFVAQIAAPPASGRVISDLAGRGFRVAILSNWPLAATIDRFAEGAGWMPALHGIFVSQRIGTIKPHRGIFAYAAAALGVAPSTILHVGDDWAADVVGAVAAGWRAAYLTGHQVDTPLPTSERSAGVRPDLELEALSDLGGLLSDPPPAQTRHATA